MKQWFNGLMEQWIYENLKRYGNVAISKKTFKKFGGEEKIIEDLKNHNLSCHIRKTREQLLSYRKTKDHVVLNLPEYGYIIEVITNETV